MNMGGALLRGAIRDLDESAFSQAVHGTARALLEQHGVLMLGPRSKKRRVLMSSGVRSFWTAPDALWEAACRRRPCLRRYPLGECCERAFKQTVMDLLVPAASANAAAKGGAEPDPRNPSSRDVLARFLQLCFFEICIDRLRRPGWFASGYNFSRRRRMVSPGAEAALRQRLAKQCGDLARGYLEKAREEANSVVLADRRVGEALESLVDARPRRAQARRRANQMNVIAGPAAKSPARLRRAFRLAPQPLRLLWHSARYNVSFSFDHFQEYLGRRLRPCVKDLLDLGVAVFMSDLYVRRMKNLGRRIGLLLSVRHPARWSAAGEEIRRTIAHLGRDDFDVRFLKLRGPTKDGPYKVRADRRCICLFSGGLDSAAGVAWAIGQGMEPLLVSHYGQSNLSGIQQGLISELERRFGRKLDRIGFYVGPRKKTPASVPTRLRPLYPLGGQPASVMTQYLRSFLFLTAAAALALETGTHRIYVFENGPVALNPLISEGRVNTRTAHPHVLNSFREIIQRVFNVDLDIRNPLQNLTKGEVAGLLKKAGLEGSIAKTVSCWNWFNVPVRAKRLGVACAGARHDGDCLPCVVRQAAVNAAAIRKDARYLVDVFQGHPNLGPDQLSAIADLLRFCRTVLALDDAALLRRVPELSVSVPGISSPKLMAMLRRYAWEVREVFRQRANGRFRRDFAAVLKGSGTGRRRRI